MLLLGVLATQAWSAPAEVTPGTFTILGRVVDEGRARVAGAVVRVHVSVVQEPASEVRTDARGRFRFEIPVADLATTSDTTWYVLARHDARVGVGSTSYSSHGVGFVETIVVKPGLDVPVRIPGARAGVRVRAWDRPSSGHPCAEAQTDAEGRAVLRNLPSTWVSIEAGELAAGLDLRQEVAPVPEVRLAARPMLPVVVDVAGVPPEARERTWVEVLHPNRFGRPIQRLPLAQVTQGPIDVPPAAFLRAGTDHASPPRSVSRWVELSAGTRRVELHVVQPRPFRWPATAGSAPVPPDGAVLRVLRLASADEWAFPALARIERGQVAVDAVGEETQMVWAFAPDGSAARLVRSPYGREPLPTEFRRARTIHVRLREADGRPVVGALVWGNRDNSRPPIVIPPTDAEGRTRLVEFADGPLDFTISEGAPSLRRLARVETDGDATLDVVLLPKVTVVLRVLLDGRPGLPSQYRVSCLGQDIEDAEEDAVRGEIRFEARPPAQGAAMEVYFGGALGWTPEGGREIGGLRRTVDPGVPLTLRLRRQGILRVRLSGAKATDRARRVFLESSHGDRWEPMNRKWDEELYLHAVRPLVVRVDPGTWRLRDDETGRSTDPVVIGAPAAQEVVERTLEIGP